MPNIVELELNGRKYELFFSCKAMDSLAKRCGGDLGNMSAMLEGLSEPEVLKNICGMLCDLVNGAVVRHNCDVALGLCSGEKKPEYPEDYFVSTTSPTDAEKIINAIFEAMEIGSEFNVPDNVKVEEKDIDLAEIEAEKQSKKS